MLAKLAMNADLRVFPILIGLSKKLAIRTHRILRNIFGKRPEASKLAPYFAPPQAQKNCPKLALEAIFN